MSKRQSVVARLALLAILSAGSGGWSLLRGQGTCEVNNQASCLIAGSVAQSITVTLPKLARLTVPVGAVSLPSPATVAALETTFGAPATLSLEVRANTPWSLAVSSSASVWSATPLATARQNKPVSELEWSLSAGAGFAGITSAPVTVRSETVPGIHPFNVYFRAKFDFGLDVPGAYSVPITLLLTAP